MLTNGHYISAFRFPDRADVTRYVPKFDVKNYGHQIRRFLSGSDSSPKSDSTSPALSDEIFFTPTSLHPSAVERKTFKENM